ncbi:MAG: TonB-dependent receptor plug domain-containing protein [Sphingobacteriales bacterium]
MNYKRIIAGLFLIGGVIALLGFARTDDDPVSKIIARLDKWVSTHPQEKVYLQLDKPYYVAGDDIWFKAYITAGSEHSLSAISRILYVELVDDKDSIKQSIKLPVLNGLTWGDFALSDTLKEGNYRVRAYTSWMRNAGDDYFFDKAIVIGNASENNVFTQSYYTYTSRNGQQQINAVISYSDLNGTPYGNAEVNYQVELGSKIANKGKGDTDDKGNLNISFGNTLPGISNPGRIITNIMLPGKKTVEKSVLIKAVSAKADVQFFPEGGNLVNGNESKIAFKAVGADGLGTAIKGVVTDDQNNQVISFSSSHSGMGEFVITPENNKNYKAKITYTDGSENVVNLPEATNSGYSLSIDNSDDDNIQIKISSGPEAMINTGPTGVMTLVAQSGGTIYYASKSKPGRKFLTATVPKSKFPTGIVQFTLFSPTGEPLNERLSFIQNHDQLKLAITADQPTYQPRQKAKITMNVRGKNNTPVIGSFSVSVTDETKVPVDETDESTILSNLLLTSELKGYIEKPNYYFTNINEKTTADLDILMLTQGYHRFEWKQVLADNTAPVVYQPEKSIEITGHLKNWLGKPVAGGKVILFSKSGGTFLIDTVSDSEGRFTFKNLVFGDSITFVIQARTAKDHKNIEIYVDSVARPKGGHNKNTPDLQVNISSGMSNLLQNSKNWYNEQLKYGLNNHAIMLKTVEIKAKKISPAEHSDNLNGPGNADQVLAGSDIGAGCPQISICLQGRLLGVTFQNGVPYLNRSSNIPMTIVIDGLSIDSGADILNNLNANDIESIEVLRSIAYTSIYGSRGSGGVLIITTKRGLADFSVKSYAPWIITYSPKGYHKVRSFYSPQYDNPKTNAQIPDLRSTVYWGPNIITDNDGKASFEFFNADAKGTYRVVVEGIDSNGNLGRQIFRYKVE